MDEQIKITVSRYFSEGAEEIRDTNLTTMRSACLWGSAAVVLLLFATPFIVRGWRITREYYYLIPILMIFYVFSRICLQRKRPVKPVTVEIACALLFVLLLGDLIAISVFPYPAGPQIFITVSFLVLPVIFIQRPWVVILTEVLGEAAFLLLAFAFKESGCASLDMFSSLTGVVFSMIVLANTTKLHVRDYDTRRQLWLLGRMDTLTGLMNKGAFESACEAWLSRQKPERPCALIVMDLDDFKHINDTFGHRCGDELLQLMGATLKELFRQTDLLGRVGGDEFCIYMSESAPLEELSQRVEQVRAALAALTCRGEKVGADCSAGAALCDKSDVTYDRLFARADAALYEAKSRGKGACVFAVNSAGEL